MPQFEFECTFLRHISTDAISDRLEWKLRLSSFRGTGTQGTKQPYTKKLGQNFGAGISSQELCQDDILMTSSYGQNCLWPEPPGGGRGHLGIFWVGMCRPGLQIGTKKNSPKIDTPFKKWANFSYPVLKFALKLIPRSRNGPFSVLESL